MPVKFDREERRILKSFDRGEWRPVKNLEREKQRYRKAAAATLRKRGRVNAQLR